MTVSPLEHFLIGQLFTILLIFTRVGTGLMFMPFFGERVVTGRARLLMALAIAVTLAPVFEPVMPKVPASPFSLAVLLVAESLVGASIGMVCRFLISVMHIAGMIISVQSSLAVASQFDPTQAGQGSLIGNFLSMAAVVFLIATDMHYVMLRGLADSYSLFTPGAFPPVEDLAQYFSTLTSSIFLVSLKLSAPVVVIGLIVYIGGGVLTRLMPNLQIFFIILPAQIALTFFIMIGTFAAMMLSFGDYYAATFSDFLKLDGYTGF
ncbi:MAG: flagellar biosynthetic protein FliR [Rickettsiales bacterium]